MRDVSFVRGLPAIAVVLLGCQPAMVPTVEAPAPRGQPHILVDDGQRGVDTLVLSLTGSIGQDVTGSFRLINTGHGVLELTQVTPLDGLVRAPAFLDESSPDFELELPREPIASGAWVTVPVVFHARRGGSSVSSRLELRFGGGDVIVFSLVGEVLRSDCVEALDVDFGAARVGERIERVITLHNPSADDQFVQLDSAEPHGVFGISRLGETVRVPGVSDVVLPVTWSPTRSGEHRATLSLSSLRCSSSRSSLRGSAWQLATLDGPTTLDFGRVEPLTRTRSSLLIRNTSLRPVSLQATIDFGDEFTVVPGQVLTIPAAIHERPGVWRTSSIEVFVDATPTGFGPRRGQLTLRDDDARAFLSIELVVDGGRAPIVVDVRDVNFGSVAFAPERLIRSRREVLLENIGATPIRLGTPSVAGRFAASGELCLGEVDDQRSCTPALPAVLAPGDRLRLPITLALENVEHDASGAKSWVVTIPTDAPAQPIVELQVTATPLEAQPCSLELTTELENQPARVLDFGEVRVGLSATGTVRLCNAAPLSAANERCLVDSFRLRPATAAFAIDHSAAGVVLAPCECEVVTVRAMPFVRGAATSELEFMTSAPERGLMRLPLRVEGR